MLACPHCALPLLLNATGASCENGHTFDRGRGGYLNLLPSGRLGSRATAGDTPDSLAARRRFLNAGHYAPIARAIADAVGEPEGPVLDVGCGEGYYLSQLRPTTQPRYGLDVAKTAVQLAARAYPEVQFVVGTAYRLPVIDHSVGVVLSVFAPHPLDEFARVLQPGGRWVTATPGANHLQEMRPDLSDRERVGARLERRSEAPAEATSSVHVEFELDLDAEAANDLYLMTPIRWQKGARMNGPASVTVDVWVASGA